MLDASLRAMGAHAATADIPAQISSCWHVSAVMRLPADGPILTLGPMPSAFEHLLMGCSNKFVPVVAQQLTGGSCRTPFSQPS